jgi:hypothetical protein
MATTSRTDGAVIGQPKRGFNNLVRVASVAEIANSFLPTSTATTTVDDLTGAACTTMDQPPGVREDHGARTPGPSP